MQVGPGFDVSSLVEAVLAEDRPSVRSRSSDRLGDLVAQTSRLGRAPVARADAYGRLFDTEFGNRAANLIGNESRTLDALSSLSLEILMEFLTERLGLADEDQRRYLAVPGPPERSPTLLVLDPAVSDVRQSRRLTDDIFIDRSGLMDAFQRLWPRIRDAEYRGLWSQEAADQRFWRLALSASPSAIAEVLWVSQPEVVLSRRPKMVPLCAPSPYTAVRCGAQLSTAGIFCRDPAGELGITACFHGTGPVGTPVSVGGVQAIVKHADELQDIVFIPLGESYAMPPVHGRAGVRFSRAPSEAEPVTFDGAGSATKVSTRVKSHDAGILRLRRTLQLKVQTPADTNSGDSGSALVDGDDRIVGFGFERTGIGEFPELTDWIWAANALRALGLTPI